MLVTLLLKLLRREAKLIAASGCRAEDVVSRCREPTHSRSGGIGRIELIGNGSRSSSRSPVQLERLVD